MPAQGNRLSALALLFSNLLLPVAIGIFAQGFFPYKPFIPGKNVYNSEQAHPAPVFDKLIFMVVDALRSDFVYSNESSFFFVQSLIRDGAAVPFTAHATSPTITMPRVKALTTGSIPSFLDVILNFAESDTTSTLANQDTWPAQLSAMANGRVIMYGDDTWLKLFPGVFSRSDGTSSFFVSDFTEVDNNVTRHISLELGKDDWNGMVLHYLGLDHIGHKSGPRSPHMRPKQQEMDNIVRQMYNSIESTPYLSSTLFVLCGDHGMNEAGNHGGSAAGETSPALLFISPKLKIISDGFESPVYSVDDEFQYYDVVEQSDVAPTIAGLLGFPVPLNNLGVFIPKLLSLWSSDSDRIQLLKQNAEQVYDIVKATFGESTSQFHSLDDECKSASSDGDLLHCLWSTSQLRLQELATSEEKGQSILNFLKTAQRIMSSTASNYDVKKLQIGVFISLISLLAIAYASTSIIPTTSNITFPVIGICITYGAIMFASSFVEEEQHFWYWSASAWFVALWTKNVRQSNVNLISQNVFLAVMLSAFRVIRRWNQTGQKHAGQPDIGRTFLSRQPLLLWVLVLLTFGEQARSLGKSIPKTRARLPLILLLLLPVSLAAICFKVAFTAADAPEILPSFLLSTLAFLDKVSLTTQARSVFVGLAWLALVIVVQNKFLKSETSRTQRTLPGLHSLLTIFLITQSRANNIPLFLLFKIQCEAMRRLPISEAQITFASIFMQYASYFAFGGTNAISSVDLSSAYNGVSNYNVLAVGVLTFVGNWAGPIWWSVSCYVLLLERSQGYWSTFIRHLVVHTFFVSASLMCVMLACTLLRTHLFIWTVFSPKYLYVMAWSLAQHLFVDTFMGAGIWAIGADN